MKLTYFTQLNSDLCEPLLACRYSEADVIPCASDEPREEKERVALRVAVLR